MPTETSNVPTLVITRIFDAPRELVWKVWTEEQHVTNWWGPRHFTAPSISIDLRPGGSFQFAMRDPSGNEHWVKGVYHEIDAPNRLVTTMWFCDPQGNRLDPVAIGFPADVPKEFHDVVTFESIEANTKTRLTIRRNTPVEVSKRLQEDIGWNQSLDKLAGELARVLG